MKINCLGACQEVGRSGFLVSENNSNILLDYGLLFDDNNKLMYPVKPQEKVDACILSHAHLDHSGFIPNIFASGKPKLVLTEPTLKLAELLWADSLKIARLNGERPPFFEQDMQKASDSSIIAGYGKEADLGKTTSTTLLDAGHIPGSSMAYIDFGSKTLLYTGDFNTSDSRLQTGASSEMPGDVDVLIVESTYCNREHEPREKVEKHFLEKIAETLENGGVAMVPAFAVGRAQEILQVISDRDFGVPVYLDGMAKDASDIIVSYPGFIRDYDGLQSALQECIWIENERERKRIKKEPYIVVTTAGMLSGGPIYHYLWANRKNNDSKILLTGYQVPGTPGERLMREGVIDIRNTELAVKQEVIKFDFSSHAGKKEIFSFVKDVNPENIVCVHGDKENTIGFATRLKEKGFNAVAPKLKDILKF